MGLAVNVAAAAAAATIRPLAVLGHYALSAVLTFVL